MEEARPPGAPNGDGLRQSGSEGAVDELRDILFSRYQRQIAGLEKELDQLQRQLADEEALAEMISPIIAEAIRRKIREDREELIEAAYPLVLRIVARAVSEAIRDFARTLDARVRTAFSLGALWRQLRARVSGVSGAEMSLRDSLPFEVEEVFLIHRESGLLLWHVSADADVSPDSDLISGMLTAIRDFAEDAFGRGREGNLDEIQYGERSILIEVARRAYLAVVVDGIEPRGFRTKIRECVVEISNRHDRELRAYDGHREPFSSVDSSLRSLLTTEG